MITEACRVRSAADRRLPVAAWFACALLIGLPLLTAEEAPASRGPSDEVLAEVGEYTITVEDFTTEIELRSANGRVHYATMEQREALLDEMVKTETVVVAALEAGYDQDPAYQAAIRKILVGRYVEDHLQTRLQSLTVSEAEVRQEFESHRATYRRPERVKGAIIFLEVGPRASEEQVAETALRAEELREAAIELTEINHLGELAQKNSDDRATRYTGGVLPWLVRGAETRWGSAVVEVLFEIEEIGGVGPVVITDDGFYVVRLVDREGPQELPYEMYAAGIRRQILQQKREAEREAFYRELEARTGVVMHREALVAVPGLQEPPAEAPPRPPALPGN